MLNDPPLGERARILVVCLLAVCSWPAAARAQELTADEARRVAPYYTSWELADAPPSVAADVRPRLTAAITQARTEFGGRGPDLARHFLRHIQASPGNTAFFFLFRAVGDAETARILIDALLSQPVPEGMVLGRDPAEIGIAIQAVLQNDVGNDPAILAALQDTLARARQRPGGGGVVGVVVPLIGYCRTPEAAGLLERLAADPDPSVRSAAIDALGAVRAPSAAQALQRALADADPANRARAAAGMAQGESDGAAASLEARLRSETDPQVIDAAVSALTRLHALPRDRQGCLAMASRCWDVAVAQPLFDCWRAAAGRDDLIEQATSGSWTVRALALRALTQVPELPARSLLMLNGLDPSRVPPPVFEPPVRARLLQSLVEMLSQDIAGLPAPNTLAYLTVKLARDALWEISGRDMSVALDAADRIRPISGRYTSAGLFGASYDLASRDRAAYAARRLPWQLLAAGAVAVFLAALLAVRALSVRRIAAALLVSVCMWAVWFSVQPDFREMPPLPLAFLTISCLAFLTAGLVSGAVSLLPIRGWLKLPAAPVAAGVCALLLCAFTRSARLYPIGGEGWELIFDPAACALLAAPAAFAITLGLARWKS